MCRLKRKFCLLTILKLGIQYFSVTKRGGWVDRVVRFVAPGQVDVVEAPRPEPAAGQVLLRTLYSGISAGTELTAYLGTNPYLHRSWDAERKLFVPGARTLDYPVLGWGYEEVGIVEELGPGTTGLVPGDTVWGLWGHRAYGVLAAETARHQLLPSHVDPLSGIFARVGAVALNALIDADTHIGETVVVFGQGVIGLLATRLAALSGATVVAVDAVPERLDRAREQGAAHTLHASEGSPAEAVRELTGGRGADVCIELSGTYGALHEAVRTVGYNGRVVAAGFYQGEAAALRLGEEFHHNRVQIVASQISGVAPVHGSRWDKDRLHRGFMGLVVDGRVDPVPLVTHLVGVEDVAHAFALVAERPTDLLQAVLDFRATGAEPHPLA
jgi:2-desacetyl-2-hydroxyethyl bacteriochlorophyllide A dehydrogenase